MFSSLHSVGDKLVVTQPVCSGKC